MFQHVKNKIPCIYRLDLALNSYIHKNYIKIKRRDESFIGKDYGQDFTCIISSPAMVKHKIMLKTEKTLQDLCGRDDIVNMFYKVLMQSR